jgi:phage-related minor tail protein
MGFPVHNGSNSENPWLLPLAVSYQAAEAENARDSLSAALLLEKAAQATEQLTYLQGKVEDLKAKQAKTARQLHTLFQASLLLFCLAATLWIFKKVYP